MKLSIIISILAVLMQFVGFAFAFAANPVCVPGRVVGCGVCNPTGTAWANDDSKCASGKICQNWACVAAASRIKSSLESASCAVVNGWICDPNNTGAQFSVDFYLDDTTADGYLGNAVANGNRNDIADQCGNTAAHGFSFAMPANTSNGVRVVADGVTHVIHAAGKRNPGDWFIFAESPKSISCSSCVPATCLSQNRSCGSLSDGCGNTLDCGACSSGRTCSNGVCASCEAKAAKKCDQGNLYWYDSCGTRGELAQNCNSATAAYRCNANLLQKQNNGDCINGACAEPSWSTVLDCAQTGKACKNNSCVAGDTAPPIISGLGPAGTAYSPAAALTATTNEPAVCRYGLADVVFNSLPGLFGSSGGLYHSAPVTLAKYGSFTYFVRCIDTAGNANASPAKILFKYAAAAPVQNDPPPVVIPPPAKDTAAPIISGLTPAGKLEAAPAQISAATDEKATCKYDIADTDFDSMENKLEAAANGTSHRKPLAEINAGAYTYYVRCKDAAGNKNTQSAKIEFAWGTNAQGLAISDLSPSGAVYQSFVALSLATAKPAECRYSLDDADFDSMEEVFATADGQNQQAMVTLGDYGSYAYYVRCRDVSGNKDAVSQVIGFEYKNPDEVQIEKVADPAPEAECAEYTTAAANSDCSNASDCVCDPDCSADSDPDCAKIVAVPVEKNNSGFVFTGIAIALLVIIAAVVMTAMARKRGEDGEE